MKPTAHNNMNDGRKEAPPTAENGANQDAPMGFGCQFNFQHQPQQHYVNLAQLPQNYTHAHAAQTLHQATPQNFAQAQRASQNCEAFTDSFFSHQLWTEVETQNADHDENGVPIAHTDEFREFLEAVASVNDDDDSELLSSAQNNHVSAQDAIDFNLPIDNRDVNFNPDDFNNFLQAVATLNDNAQNNPDTAQPSTILPLRQWVLNQGQNNPAGSDQQKLVLINKVTVAYAIGKLLQHLKVSVSSYSQDELLRLCSVDNFAVHMSAADATNTFEVVAIDMIIADISMNVSSNATTDENEKWARNVETVITKHSPSCCAKSVHQAETTSDNLLCYSLGVLLHFLFSGADSSIDLTGPCNNTWGSGNIGTESAITPMSQHIQHQSSRPAKLNCMPSSLQHENKFSRAVSLSSHNDHAFSGQNARSATKNFPSLQSLGFHSNVSQLVKNLLECECEVGLFRPDDSYPSLEIALDDMSLLFREPIAFLFESNAPVLNTKSDKLYGRTSEAASLSDAFVRVAASGQSEAFVIGGFSGSGKTRLVQSAFQTVFFANGMLITRKFEETSNNQLSIVLSAFDDLCVLIAERSSVNSIQHIWQRLMSEFGTNMHLLARLLPNVLRLAPSSSAALMIDGWNDNEGGVNFFSLCDNIQRFMRVVSSSSCPVFLFLDDLQWADPVSLGLVHTVLADRKGASCVFFVGNYRDNEVKPDHIIFGFYEKLSAFNVLLSTLHLDGIPEDDVNAMISDTLGMFPRLCWSLSQLVYRKTKGNPFFVQTFLRSLVDKGYLNYSLRKKVWTWDVDEIISENVTPNVLDLISAKMTDLTQNLQTALKVASCFGIGIKVSIVQNLSATKQYSTLPHDLNEAVQDGFMDLCTDKSNYRFVHDKVREAAYGMIHGEDKDRFHFDVGMALISTYKPQVEDKSDTLFDIIDQVDHGVPALLHGESQRISIAKLNLEAATNEMQSYNYTSAYRHAKAAVSLLPSDSWTTHHGLSLDSHFELAKSAYPYSKIDEARSSLEQVMEHASSLQTRLEAYKLLHSIILGACAPKDYSQLITTMAYLLRSLGEDLPSDDDSIKKDLANQVFNTKRSIERNYSDDALMNMYKSSSESQVAIVHAYSILVHLTYVAKPKLFPYYAARAMQYCLNSKVACKYIPGLYVTFAVVLCEDMSKGPDMQIGYRIAKLGVNMLNQNTLALSEIPWVYIYYYGHIGVLFEPIQACIEMHRRAYELGMQLGNTSISAFHKSFVIARELHAGTNLLRLKEEIEFDMKMAKHHSLPIFDAKSQQYYDAVLTLIDGESRSSQEPDASKYDTETAYIMSRMVISTYLGYFERVKHMAEKWEFYSNPNNSMNSNDKRFNFRNVYVSFYYGIALFALRRRKKSSSNKMPDNMKKLLGVMQNASKYSAWNYLNKASLLEAEKLSFCLQNSEAEAAYDVAIKTSHSSKFVHEEGLACELAGGHFERLGKMEQAISLFQQAQRCYKIWGSKKKTLQMAEKAERIRRKGPR